MLVALTCNHDMNEFLKCLALRLPVLIQYKLHLCGILQLICNVYYTLNSNSNSYKGKERENSSPKRPSLPNAMETITCVKKGVGVSSHHNVHAFHFLSNEFIHFKTRVSKGNDFVHI